MESSSCDSDGAVILGTMVRIEPCPCIVNRWPLTLLLFIQILAAVGCAATRKVPSVQQEAVGAVLGIRLFENVERPHKIVMRLQAADSRETITLPARVIKRSPGAFIDYLIALAIPAGQYEILGLFVVESSSEGSERLLAALRTSIDIPSDALHYLGRIVVHTTPSADGANGQVVENAFEEDAAALKQLAPQLDGIRLRPALIREPLASPGTAVTKTDACRDDGGIVSMSAEALDAPEPSRRSSSPQVGLARFLRLGLPRALAADEHGTSAASSGRSAVRAALDACNRRSPTKSCRVVAVDRMLVGMTSCRDQTSKGR